jgi:Ca2+-binding RTX toxin-like protein
VTRQGPIDTAATVDWSVDGMQATASDFAGGVLPGGSLTFAAGQATQTITVQVVGDTFIEPSERFAVVLDNASIPIARARAEMLIINDDVAGSGNDILLGSAVADLLEGGAGDDLLYGAGGSDTLRGGAGADRFHYAAASEGGDVILDFQAGVDHISFDSTGFGGLGGGGALQAVSVASAGDLAQTLAAVTQAQDVDVYRIEFAPGEFDFGQGASGQLDELEAAFSAGDHSGPAFVFVSDGEGDARLFYDADTSAGTDGSGWVELARLPDVDVLTLPDDVVQTAV